MLQCRGDELYRLWFRATGDLKREGHPTPIWPARPMRLRHCRVSRAVLMREMSPQIATRFSVTGLAADRLNEPNGRTARRSYVRDITVGSEQTV